MAKPIFIVKVPKGVTPRNIEDNMESIRGELADYHVLFVSANVEEYAFECFLATKADNEKIEKLINELNER